MQKIKQTKIYYIIHKVTYFSKNIKLENVFPAPNYFFTFLCFYLCVICKMTFIGTADFEFEMHKAFNI